MLISNWDNLRVFLAVARSGATDAAARTLKVDSSTVRRRMASLEEAIGAPLIERIEGEPRLTHAGLLLLKAVEEVEHLIESAETKLSLREAAVAGVVRIGAPEGTGAFLLAPALARMQEEYPEVRVELATLPRVLDVARREVDIMILHELPPSGQHKIRKLMDLEIGLYGSSDYLDSHLEITTSKDLMGHKFVFYDDWSDYFESMLKKYLQFGEESWIKLKTTSTVSQACAVSAGAGLALIPDFIARHWTNLRPVLRGEVFVRSNLWMLTHRDVADRLHVQAAARAILSACDRRTANTARSDIRQEHFSRL